MQRGKSRTSKTTETQDSYNPAVYFLRRGDIFAPMPPSGLCVGLDIDLAKLPRHLQQRDDAVVLFNHAVIEATRHVAASYKINLAFYEKLGRSGIDAMYATREMVGSSYLIADAKRGDIGNTSSAYAAALFEDLRADAVTVAPYMGRDSVEPFLAVPGRMVYVLALTSNPGSQDFQRCLVDGEPLYRRVMRLAQSWERSGEIGFVVGATHPDELAEIRTSWPDVPLLIPGLGSQGGDEAATVAANGRGPALYNVSRGLLYRSGEENFHEAIRTEAERLAGVLTS